MKGFNEAIDIFWLVPSLPEHGPLPNLPNEMKLDLISSCEHLYILFHSSVPRRGGSNPLCSWPENV